MLEYINRQTKIREEEKVFGEKAMRFLLRGHFLARFLQNFAAKNAWVSKLYGALQRTRSSRKKIAPFIEAFQVDKKEFEKDVEEFTSFDDFFTRKLKPESRPISTDPHAIITPADGRYLVFPDVSKADGFWVKGKTFSLTELLQDESLAEKYQRGALVIARLAPPDYHRFHFPVDCIPSSPRLINGPLFSVNPLFLRKNISILSENKRVITSLKTEGLGDVLMIEIGATNVGSIHQTYTPNQPAQKGQEKGYFSFGGSCIALLFEPGKIELDADFLEASSEPIEVKTRMGDSLAKSLI